MKKFLLVVAVALFATSAFAQDYKNSIGLRLGYGAELQYERHFSAKNYLEANLGLYGFDTFDVNATYNWNCFEWNWTPRAGKWFLSAGVGASAVMARKYFNVGVAGDVAFGIRFNKPVTLSLDYRPTIFFLHNAWGSGFYGFALTCTYNF
ncbi:MAG: hypothetical protein E7146_01985 [Rikenellaceae bacterium]|nr:hypothetical protein [Rikenellaceae bacterium]